MFVNKFGSFENRQKVFAKDTSIIRDPPIYSGGREIGLVLMILLMTYFWITALITINFPMKKEPDVRISLCKRKPIFLKTKEGFRLPFQP